MWWKKNKWKIIIPIVIVAVLAVAFWFGGGAPGMQGLPDKGETVVSPSEPAPEAPAVTPEKESAPEEPPKEETPEQPETPDEPENTPEEAPVEDPPVEPEPEEAPPEAPSEPEAPDENETQPETVPEPEMPDEPHMEINPQTGQDKYLTDPVPEGRPIPVEPQDVTITDIPHTCTISISCSTILDNMDWLDPEKVELVPEDGWILKPITVTFYEGESVFNVLQRVCKQQKIHMEFENTPMYNSAYIEGINNLYEFDCGELSGWMYKVNDWFPNYGCSRYALKEGDVICWVYTCDLGVDVGGYYAVGG